MEGIFVIMKTKDNTSSTDSINSFDLTNELIEINENASSISKENIAEFVEKNVISQGECRENFGAV